MEKDLCLCHPESRRERSDLWIHQWRAELYSLQLSKALFAGSQPRTRLIHVDVKLQSLLSLFELAWAWFFSLG